VGYQDVSYFTGLFRRMHDVTPNAYRRLVRTKLFNVGNPSPSRP
jgi:AraC-like DNA-binding protein